MTLPVALFIFGAVLFFLGFVGKVKIADIEIGTTSKILRGASLIFGILLMVKAFNFMPKNQEDNSKSIIFSQPQITETSSHKEKFDKSRELKLIGATSLKYWKEQSNVSDKYAKLIEFPGHIPNNLTKHDYLDLRINYLKEILNASLMYLRKSRIIPLKNVDHELAKNFIQLQYLQSNLVENLAKYLHVLENAKLLLLEKQNIVMNKTQYEYSIEKLKSEEKHLQDRFHEIGLENKEMTQKFELLRIKLINKYKIEFPPLYKI